MLSEDQVKELVEIRKSLHRIPEPSGSETSTASAVRTYLERFGADEIIGNIGGCGVAGIYHGKDRSRGKTWMIRAELDALAIEEQNELEYHSGNKGYMHACGHDGHMAMVLGVAMWLQHHPPRTGTIVLLFQPAEETGEGSGRVIDDPKYKALEIERGIALHNLPGFSENTIYIRSGSFASASVGLKITFKGKSSHAAYPEQGINPSLAMALLIQKLEKVKQRSLDHENFRVLTITYLKAGKPAFGINPGKGEIGITVRAETDEGIENLLDEVQSEIDDVQKQFRGTISSRKKEPFSATINDPEGVKKLESVALERGVKINHLESPIAWSEDFGEFRKNCSITLFGLGAGKDSAPLHSEYYDFNDDLIPVGVSLFCEWINKMTNE